MIFKLNFQFSKSQNTGKCELGRFSLKQLHIPYTVLVCPEFHAVFCNPMIYQWSVTSLGSKYIAKYLRNTINFPNTNAIANTLVRTIFKCNFP